VENQRELEKWETLTKRYLAIESEIRIKHEIIRKLKDRLQINETDKMHNGLSFRMGEKIAIRNGSIPG
jgi:hypothetical protein